MICHRKNDFVDGFCFVFPVNWQFCDGAARVSERGQLADHCAVTKMQITKENNAKTINKIVFSVTNHQKIVFRTLNWIFNRADPSRNNDQSVFIECVCLFFTVNNTKFESELDNQ